MVEFIKSLQIVPLNFWFDFIKENFEGNLTLSNCFWNNIKSQMEYLEFLDRGLWVGAEKRKSLSLKHRLPYHNQCVMNHDSKFF